MSTPNPAPILKVMDPVVFTARKKWFCSVNFTPEVSKSSEVNAESEPPAVLFAEALTSAPDKFSPCPFERQVENGCCFWE